MGETDAGRINTLVNAWLTASELIDRYWPIAAVLAVAAVAITLMRRSLYRAARYVDDFAEEQQQIAADIDTRKETP